MGVLYGNVYAHSSSDRSDDSAIVSYCLTNGVQFNSAVYGEHILFLILELLKLYDRRKDTTILDIVIQLLDFLSEKDASQVDLYQINRLQTEKRRRKLNPEEIQYLSSMKSKGIPAQYQLAANILLESFYEAQLIYDQLCPEEKEVFASYPIMNLWKSKG